MIVPLPASTLVTLPRERLFNSWFQGEDRSANRSAVVCGLSVCEASELKVSFKLNPTTELYPIDARVLLYTSRHYDF